MPGLHRTGGSVNADQRDRLLDLHRAAMTAQGQLFAGDISPRACDAADDAFRDYLMGLEITQ